GPDLLLIKYSNAGAPLWTNRYDGPGHGDETPVGMVVDGSDNVIVAMDSIGSSGEEEFATVKDSTAGAPVWTNRYHGPGSGNDEVYGVAVDTSGNVCVTGSSFGIGTSKDYATIKYSSAGVPLWTNRYNGPGNGDDYPIGGLAVDASGNVFV